MNKKIIFSDVDGTIYDYSGRLPESTVLAIKKLRENGHLVYMVTGRSKAENKKELWDIGFDGMIGGNGSYVEADGKVLLHQTISLDQCTRIVDWCHKRNIEFYEESNNGLFASKRFSEKAVDAIRKYALGKGMDSEKAKNLKVDDAIHGLIENENLYRNDLNKVSFLLNSYDDYLEAKKSFPDMNVGTWGGKDEQALFGDFGIKDIDKAKAIDILLNHLNVSRKDTVAIGDAQIDIPMLEYCDRGLTFSSGGKQIKEIADYISDDVDKDGFYKAFKHLGLI